jgi:hypothetical protein
VTDNKIQNARDEAKKAKDDLKKSLVEQKAKLNQKYERKEELERKRRAETKSIQDAFLSIAEGNRTGPATAVAVDKMGLQSGSAATPSRPAANAPLEAPIASPITPIQSSAPSPAVSASRTVGTTFNSQATISSTPATSTPQRQPVGATSSTAVGNIAKPATNPAQKQPIGTVLSTPTGRVTELTSNAPRNAPQSTRQKQPLQSPLKKPEGSNTKAASNATHKAVPSTPSKSLENTPSKSRAATPSSKSRIPQGPLQGAPPKFVLALPPNTPTKPRPQGRNPPISTSHQVNGDRIPSAPRQDELRMVPQTPTPSSGEKRKSGSQQMTYASQPRLNVYDDFGDDSDGGGVDSGSRPTKRSKTTGPVHRRTPSRMEGNKSTSPQKADSNRLSQRLIGPRSTMSENATGHQLTPSHVPAEQSRQAISQTGAGQPQTVPQNMAGHRPAPSLTPTQLNRAIGAQSSSMTKSPVKKSPSTPPKARMSIETTAPYHLSPINPNKPVDFDLDRFCCPSKEGRYFSWSLKEDCTHYYLRLENGMYRPYVGDKVGGSVYACLMISPGRIVKLEYHTEERLVKVTLGNVGARKTYIWFGFKNGVEDFLESLREGWRGITPVKAES